MLKQTNPNIWWGRLSIIRLDLCQLKVNWLFGFQQQLVPLCVHECLALDWEYATLLWSRQISEDLKENIVLGYPLTVVKHPFNRWILSIYMTMVKFPEGHRHHLNRSASLIKVSITSSLNLPSASWRLRNNAMAIDSLVDSWVLLADLIRQWWISE